MRQPPLLRWSPGATAPRLFALLVLGGLLISCQGDQMLRPSPDGALLSKSGGDDDDSDGNGRLKGTIAFHSNRDGDFEIFVMNADGSQQTQLTFNDRHEFDPVWSPDGKKLAFTSFPADFSSNGKITVMNADGSNPTAITDGSSDDSGPAWSPDGKQIAFTSFRDGDGEIYIMKADGTNQRRLTTGAYVAAVTAWSPDGKQIAFWSYRDFVTPGEIGDLDIWAVDVRTKQEAALTVNNINDAGDHASWSPDGKRFVFARRRNPPNWEIGDPGGDFNIWVMNADGTGQMQLTDSPDDDDDPTWSPDGKYITFQSTRDRGAEEYNEEVYVMRADGSHVTRLTVSEHPFPLNFDAVPVWTKRQVLKRDKDGERER